MIIYRLKAFDSVNRAILWHKLLEYGVSPHFVGVLKNMYDGIIASVRTSPTSITEPFTCARGLRQGDSLSAILFILFVNDLEKFMLESECRTIFLDTLPFLLMFLADDLSLFDTEIRGLQRKLNLLAMYCDRYQLEVNIRKTNVVVFRGRGNLRDNEKWYYKGICVETADTYTYLGVEVSSNCNWEEAKATRIRKSTRALFKVYRNLNDFGTVTPSLVLRIFDSKILPILLYGCEIWGVGNIEDVISFANKFYKYLLRLKSNASVLLARGELGRKCLNVIIYERVIKFWIQCVSADVGSAKHCAYIDQCRMVNDGVNCWAGKVRDLLFLTGFGDVWINQSKNRLISFAHEFKHRYTTMDFQTWHGSIEDASSFRTYRLVKSVLDYEPYLDMNMSLENRNLITRLRGALLGIRSNTGRWYENIEYERRICEFCNSGQVENEYHVLFECSVWSTFRCRMNTFPEFRDKDMIKVLSAENENLVRELCVYLKDVLQFRSDILQIL